MQRRTTTTSGWRCVVVVAVLIAGCTGASLDGEPDVTTNQYSVRCAQIIDTIAELPDGYVELAGAVAMPLPMPMKTGRSENGYRFSKFGMAIRVGVSATLAVDAEQGEAYLDYGGSFDPQAPSDRSRSLSFPQCEKDGVAWVIYAGGIWTTTNGCVDVTVTSQGTSEQAVLGIRTTC